MRKPIRNSPCKEVLYHIHTNLHFHLRLQVLLIPRYCYCRKHFDVVETRLRTYGNPTFELEALPSLARRALTARRKLFSRQTSDFSDQQPQPYPLHHFLYRPSKWTLNLFRAGLARSRFYSLQISLTLNFPRGNASSSSLLASNSRQVYILN